MTTTEVAARSNISRAAVTQAEQSERAGTIRLDTLTRFADALGCDVVYYLIPRLGSIQATVDHQVDAEAALLASRVGQTMALEDQDSISDADRHELLRRAVVESDRFW